MKTTHELLINSLKSESAKERYSLDETSINKVMFTGKQVKELMKLYAKEVIDEMMTLGDHPKLGLIYSSMQEAYYDYDKVSAFLNNLK